MTATVNKFYEPKIKLNNKIIRNGNFPNTHMYSLSIIEMVSNPCAHGQLTTESVFATDFTVQTFCIAGYT